ncbi:MAG: HAD family hydrolase [Ruminococcaceae bacterium]|nr:HAD family hydrolase [Oscillospiraceae bacterium]
MLRYVLFDLDGTLTDPGPGITNCVRYALEKFDVHPESREELYPYIGPPLTYSFQEFHGLTADQAEQALLYYRERFSVIGLFENEVYPGIPRLLKELKDRGVTLIVATSKPEEFTVRILEHFDLAKYFTFVGGNTLNEDRPTKGAVIAYIREQFPSITRENTIMVGDRKYDIEGAHTQNLPALGVLYGYGDRAEMTKAGAEWIAETVEQLGEILKSR